MKEAALEPTEATAEAVAWKDVTLLLLGAAADHPVQCGEGEADSFRKHVRDSIDALQNATGSAQILMNAGGVAQAIKHYGEHTQNRVNALLADMKETAQVFLNHLEELYRQSEAKPILSALRSTMEQTLAEGKLGPARDAALASLEELAKLAAEARTHSLQLTDNLQDRIVILEQAAGSGRTLAPAPAPTVDTTTGLPKRADAEFAIQRALDHPSESGLKFYAAVFYLHRMPLTNARFGEAIGNQVLLFCSQHIATTVTRANDSLFRWSGPAFVAILERAESEMAVSSEVQRLISAPFSRFFETSSRSVYLPVKVTADVIPLFDTNFAEAAERIERFVLKTSGQGSAD
jgi:GGDEF domain-containing protein